MTSEMSEKTESSLETRQALLAAMLASEIRREKRTRWHFASRYLMAAALLAHAVLRIFFHSSSTTIRKS